MNDTDANGFAVADVAGGQVGDGHDWQDRDYVERWIVQDATDDERRRPQLRHAAAALPLPRDETVSVLDVGAGYGEFSAAVLDVLPCAIVHLQDFSAAMLEQARDRLASQADRCRLHETDLRDPNWIDQVEGPFDAVVSALTVHNLGAPGAIAAAYHQIAGLLRPGGWFFNLDLVLDVALAAPTAPLTAIHRRLGGDREDQHRHHDHHDPGELHPAGLTDHLRWLTEAGFDNVDCPRKELSEVFLVAQRPASR